MRLRNGIRPLTACIILGLTSVAHGQWLSLESGHLKGQYILTSYPDDSLSREFIDTPGQDYNADTRLVLKGRKNRWSWQADYQLSIRSGDSIKLGDALTAGFLTANATVEDNRRFWDLTQQISEDESRIISQRADRLSLSYAGDNVVVRAGRQAISWGNGLLYNPVDVFNPFDPAAIDREYKTGDDMLYAQYLLEDGNDWQMVSVWRRDDDGKLSSDENSHAVKYHAFSGENELDVLLARHYGDTIASLGGVSSIGGAIVRGDIMVAHTDTDDYLSAVVNLSYSWVKWGKNMSGVFEYFYNGVGLDQRNYEKIATKQDLIDKFSRTELFTLGKHYLAAALSLELTPLINVSPNLFFNLGDSSGLAQIVGRYDVEQNTQLLLAVNFPFGATGTEFGGIDAASVGAPYNGKYLSNGPGAFFQLAYYF